MTIVMTGGAGFLGVQLLREHLAAGRHVTLIAHGAAEATRNRVERFLPPTVPLDRLEILAGDIVRDRLGLPDAVHRRLAADAEEVWHVAAKITLSGRDSEVTRTNVEGTRNVLRFLDATGADVPLRHVSTAFVAGRLHARERDTLLREPDTLAATEFENTYEASKHQAEGVVRGWAAQRGRRAVCLRPSILVPDRSDDAVPQHTLGGILDALDPVIARGVAGDRLVLRLAGDPRAYLNLLPVSWAARAMCAAAAVVDDQSDTPALHIVHPDDVAARTVSAAIEDVRPVRLRIVPARPAQPTGTEALFYRRAAGFLPYLYHRRRFDTARLRQLLPDLAAPPPIDRGYLIDALAPSRTPALAGGGRPA